jgi:taurine--2-oxoglutarate transaminase
MSDPHTTSQNLARHTMGTWRSRAHWKQPLLVTKAEGVYFWNEEGRRFLDLSSQLMCSNLGHGNKQVAQAIADQATTLPFVAPGFTTEAAFQAVQALLEVVPEGLEVFFFSTSGTEANEAAVKLARQFKAPSYKIISRYRSYHGSTPTSMALTGDPRRIFAERTRGTMPGIRFAPDPYCYRCPFGLAYADCDLQCAHYLDYMIREEGNVAALVVEPVVGTNGRIVPPPEYYPIVRQICDRHQVLLIADEVMSGWYRTGKAFAIDHWGVTPDILTTAKGCTAAYVPAGVTACTRQVAEFFEDTPFIHGHTYAYHPLAAAAIPAAVSEYAQLMASGLPQRVAEYLKQQLYELGARHPSVGDVRGIGHFWALELVRDRGTREPFNTKADKFVKGPMMTERVAKEAMEHGLYVAAWYDNLIIAPPLIITKEEVDEAIQVLDRALVVADQEAVKTDIPVSTSSEFGSIRS